MVAIAEILDIVSILVWGGAVVLVFRMAAEGYGGKFTSVYPELASSVLVLFLLGTLEFFHYEFVISSVQHASDTFVFAMNSFQLLGGLLLALALRKLYGINYMTQGFGEVE